MTNNERESVTAQHMDPVLEGTQGACAKPLLRSVNREGGVNDVGMMIAWLRPHLISGCSQPKSICSPEWSAHAMKTRIYAYIDIDIDTHTQTGRERGGEGQRQRERSQPTSDPHNCTTHTHTHTRTHTLETKSSLSACTPVRHPEFYVSSMSVL